MHLTSLEGFIGFNRVPYTSVAPNKIKDLWEGKKILYKVLTIWVGAVKLL